MTAAPGSMLALLEALAAQNPHMVELLGGLEKFEAAKQSISRHDTNFHQSGGLFFALGKTALDTAQAFTAIHVENYRKTGRPSLAALVTHHLDDIGLTPDSPHYKAAVMVAARAEIDLAVRPEYHNTHHFADVTAHVAVMLKHHNVLAHQGLPGVHKISKEDMADTLTAAVAHDLDHPGGKNQLPGQDPAVVDPFRLEEKSFQIILPLLQEAGLPPKSIDDIHTMIRTTSPDGPLHLLKAVIKTHHAGQGVDWTTIPHHERFPELEVLAMDSQLAERSAILEDADLGASAFEGLESSKEMSRALTDELQTRGYRNKQGQLEDLKGDFARKMFATYVVGDGPSSRAGQAAVGQNYHDLLMHTEQRLSDVAVKASPPKP